MAITHAESVRNAIASIITTRVNMNGGGKLALYDDAALAACIALPSPAFNPPVSGIAQLAGVAVGTVTASATVTVDNFKVTDGADNVVYQGTVSLAGGNGDLKMSRVTLSPGDAIAIDILSYIAPE